MARAEAHQPMPRRRRTANSAAPPHGLRLCEAFPANACIARIVIHLQIPTLLVQGEQQLPAARAVLTAGALAAGGLAAGSLAAGALPVGALAGTRRAATS